VLTACGKDERRMFCMIWCLLSMVPLLLLLLLLQS
jgi:hypothetical protein